MGSADKRPLRIAVIGVGLAGAAVGAFAKSLPDIDIRLYERSLVHRHVGAWIGVTPAGQLLLEEICGENVVDSICSRTYSDPTVRDWQSGRVLLSGGPLPENASPEERRSRRGQAGTTRQDLLQVIINQLPKDCVFLGKKGTSFAVNDDSATVHFHDGSHVEVDLVVVADGIKSKLRQQLYPENVVKYLPQVEYMEVFEREHLSRTIPDLPEGTHCFFQEEKMVFIGDIGRGRFGFIAVMPDDPEQVAQLGWADSMNSSRLSKLREQLEGCTPLINKILDQSRNMGIFPIARGGWLTSLIANDRICFVGDAAHPTGGAFGAGCSFAFEDAKTLTLALNHSYRVNGCWSNETIRRALELYNATRGPHILKVFQLLEASQEPGSQTERGKLATAQQMKWLTTIDTELEFQKALASEGKDPGALSRPVLETFLPAQEVLKMVAPRGSL
ncbi:hypothetical protein PMG11_07009 [Penicillium brasilianum]|uniref:FAD-binding domain-containing protein n=1 Tax=Penicillium brasilianum TaxID=104259 RepID=A0A0F7TSE2_PENBI|nr:hypothetical protein PMG11_07009 [Penicillium brasilianum]